MLRVKKCSLPAEHIPNLPGATVKMISTSPVRGRNVLDVWCIPPIKAWCDNSLFSRHITSLFCFFKYHKKSQMFALLNMFYFIFLIGKSQDCLSVFLNGSTGGTTCLILLYNLHLFDINSKYWALSDGENCLVIPTTNIIKSINGICMSLIFLMKFNVIYISQLDGRSKEGCHHVICVFLNP